MSTPTASKLLDAWERGLEQPPYERAMSLLAAALPEADGEELARWSIGRRDAALLGLRERLFGARLACVTNCAWCGAPVEVDFATADITLPPPARDSVAFRFNAPDGDYEVELRLPNTLDLRALADAPDVGRLFRRCVTAVTRNGEPRRVEDDLPPELGAEISRRAEAADPQARVELQLLCPACGQEWTAPFDIVSFFWGEVHAWAERTLREVHLLASTYGWGEAEILALSPRRRRRYLGMVTA
jgi:hypothetical protein